MDTFVNTFLTNVANRYNLNCGEVLGMWRDYTAKLAPTPTPTPSSSNLDALTVTQLKQMCKERKLPVGGVKGDLIKRLGSEQPPPPAGPKFYMDDMSGHFVHHETSLVIDQTTDLIIGKLGAKGQLHRLTAGDIDQCKEWGFKWDVNAIAVSAPSGFTSQAFDESDVDSAEST